MTDADNSGSHMRPVKDLLPGDRVDLESDRYADPDHDDIGYECEYAIVEEVIQETDDCVLVHFASTPSIGFPTDWTVRVDPAQTDDMRATGRGKTET